MPVRLETCHAWKRGWFSKWCGYSHSQTHFWKKITKLTYGLPPYLCQCLVGCYTKGIGRHIFFNRLYTVWKTLNVSRERTKVIRRLYLSSQVSPVIFSQCLPSYGHLQRPPEDCAPAHQFHLFSRQLFVNLARNSYLFSLLNTFHLCDDAILCCQR